MAHHSMSSPESRSSTLIRFAFHLATIRLSLSLCDECQTERVLSSLESLYLIAISSQHLLSPGERHASVANRRNSSGFSGQFSLDIYPPDRKRERERSSYYPQTMKQVKLIRFAHYSRRRGEMCVVIAFGIVASLASFFSIILPSFNLVPLFFHCCSENSAETANWLTVTRDGSE